MLWRTLRSAALARAILISLAAFGALGAWAPWVQDGGPPAPAWAVALRLDHPFSSPWFLAGVAALFASTFACTWGRRGRIAAVRRGELPGTALRLEGDGAALRRFLEDQGFAGAGPVLRRHGLALWGGWVLHVGLLVLIAGVLLQQVLHDGGTFVLTEGEVRSLRDPGAVFQVERGPLAPAQPPDLSVLLERFDPERKQAGYAPDRLSQLRLTGEGGRERRATIDRASGVDVDGVVIHQAIRTGLSLTLEIAGMGTRAVALQKRTAHEASAEVRDQGGRAARFVVTTERALDDPRGPGQLLVRLERGGETTFLTSGAPFDFGGPPTRTTGVRRWGSFTYDRSPGLPAVLAGFAIILLGCALLVFPAGVAVLPAGGEAGQAAVHVLRGAAVLEGDWRALTAGSAPAGPPG